MSYEPGDLSDLSTVLDFDPGSLVLTTFGRSNAGTVRGDQAIADRYLNMFFAIYSPFRGAPDRSRAAHAAAVQDDPWRR